MWNLALDMALQKQRVLFVSLEETAGEMALKAVTRFSGIPRDEMEKARKSGLSERQSAGIEKAARKLAETEMFLRLHGAETHGRTIEDVLRSATRARFDAIFIDHIGMIGRGEGKELENLSEAIDALRRLCRGQVQNDYRPFVCATTPVKRDSATADEDQIPAITDFRGSSRLEYDADLAMILRKRKQTRSDDCDDPDIVDAFVLKNRQGRCPLVLQFNAQGAICFVTERAPESSNQPQQHWQERGEQ